MKKRIFLFAIMLVVIFTSTLLMACEPTEPELWSIDRVYAEAKQLGYEGTLDELIEMFKGNDGQDGIGIESIVLNDNSEIVVTLTNGKTINLGVATGNKGEPGVGINNAYINDNGDLIIELTDGTSKNLGNIQGTDGIGILDCEINEDGELLIRFTNGTTQNLGKMPTCVHYYGNYTEVSATCTSMGYRMRECEKCHYKDYEFVEATKHYASSYDIDEGFHRFVCEKCKEYIIQAHLYDKYGICTVCDHSVYVDGIAYEINADGKSFAVTAAKDIDHLVIPDQYCGLPVTAIGYMAFAYRKITTIEIPASIISIGKLAFAYNKYLTNVIIPNSVKNIGERAFFQCDNLGDIKIPASVEIIGEEAFTMCRYIKSITVDKGNSVYHSKDNCLIETETKTLLTGCKSSVIPSDGSVTSIGTFAFSRCEEMSEIDIPDCIESIGKAAFFGCLSLKHVIIPDSVTNMGEQAFTACTGMESVVIGSGLKTIKRYTFLSNTLVNLTFGANIKTIENYAFNAPRLQNVYYLGTLEEWCDIEFEDSNSNPLRRNANGTTLYIDNEPIIELVIPESVTEIKPYAFRGCDMERVIIGDNIVSIGEYAFANCANLKEFVIGNGIMKTSACIFENSNNLQYYESNNGLYLGNNENPYVILVGMIDDEVTSFSINPNTRVLCEAFFQCRKLTTISIPDSVVGIGAFAFSRCYSLESIIVGKGVKYIDKYAFSESSNILKGVFYKGTEDEWDKINLDNSYGRNDSFIKAKRYYYSEEKPQVGEDGNYDGNYWHYVDGKLTIWDRKIKNRERSS